MQFEHVYKKQKVANKMYLVLIFKRYNMVLSLISRLDTNDIFFCVYIKLVYLYSETTLPSYENPVCVDCESKEDAEYSVEIGYSGYSSSLFYVGESYDEYDAFEKVVKYLIKNDIIDNYTGDEDMAAEYPSDFIDVMGYPFRVDNFVIHRLN